MFRALDLVGVLGNALLGGVIARREGLDLIGFGTLAVLSGLGGGMIRDVLLQLGPPVALTDYSYLLTALFGALVSFLLSVRGRVWDRAWPVIDAVALGCWATVGAQKTLDAGLGWLPAILLGVITAVGGGAVRDVVLRRVPGVLGGNTLYATPALVAAGALTLLSETGHPRAGSVAGLLVGAGVCLAARWRGWILPSADAWSPAQVVRRRPRLTSTRARRRRRASTRRRHPTPPDAIRSTGGSHRRPPPEKPQRPILPFPRRHS